MNGQMVMERNERNISLKKAMVIFTVLFYSAWAVFELAAKPWMSENIKNEALFSILENGVIKNLVWTLPAMLLVRCYSSDMYVGLKDMFTQKVNRLRYLPVFLVFAVYNLCGAYLSHGKLGISGRFSIGEIICVLFVGLTEEMVFRGWLLNATLSKDNKKQWTAVLLNAVMFLVIHFPIWIKNGIFVTSFTSMGFIVLMILSVIFSVSFIKSKNILVPITLHMFWDLLQFMLF